MRIGPLWWRRDDRWERARFKTRLPTAVSGLAFSGRLDVYWRPGPQHHHESMLVAVRDQARIVAIAISVKQSPLDILAAQDAINVRLAKPQTVPSAPEITMWARARLAVTAEDARLLAAHLEAQKADSLQRGLELARLQHLKRDVLPSLALASLWWAERNPGGLDALADGSFERFYNKIREDEQTQPEDSHQRLLAMAEKFIRMLQSPEERRTLLMVAMRVARALDHDDLTNELEEAIRAVDLTKAS